VWACPIGQASGDFRPGVMMWPPLVLMFLAFLIARFLLLRPPEIIHGFSQGIALSYHSVVVVFCFQSAAVFFGIRSFKTEHFFVISCVFSPPFDYSFIPISLQRWG